MLRLGNRRIERVYMASPTPSLRQKRVVLLATGAAVIVTLVVLYLLGNIILTIGLSALIAYTLLPVVRLLERAMPWRKRHPDLSRVSAIVIMFLVGLAAVAGILLAIVPLIVREFGMFVDEFPQLFRTARLTVENWIAIYADRIPEEIKQDLEDAIAQVGNILVGAAWDAAEKTLGVVSRSLSLIIGLATLPILVFHLMKNSGAVHPAVCAPFPSAMHTHLRAMLDIVDQTFGAYIRGQLTLGLVVGIIVAVGLFLLGVPFSILLGIIAGITELIPIIGPWIGGAAGVIVTLATAPEKALWVLLLYLAIQFAENAILVPRIQGNALRLHPVAVIVIVIISGHYFGIWGIILGPPLVAMGKDIVTYFIQEWKPPEGEIGSPPEEEPAPGTSLH